MSTTYRTLPADANQARGIARFALDFLSGEFPDPNDAVYDQVERFHRDSVACAVAALGYGMNAPMLLRDEALSYPAGDPQTGACCFGSEIRVAPEKAIAANSSAARELDANGTNFGYNPRTGDCKGEFGHNDFYPVVVAAAQITKADGALALKAMICLDEIRGRLAEVFALKDHKIDHVVHGAISSAAVYGAMLGASVDQIESAIGMTVAHYIPFRAIRAGKQLSDSKGASAAISAEAAVLSVRRAMRNFRGPADILRNPQAIFCLFEPPAGPDRSPFDLHLSLSGDDFAVMGMHFKLGLYEHQSAGAIEGLVQILSANPDLLSGVEDMEKISIAIYQPAFGIIGDPAKRDPQTRQSADHSMVYIIATMLRKALQSKKTTWRDLMLCPEDYDDQALFDPLTRQIMQRIEFTHGGAEFDAKYPDGIPTRLEITHRRLGAVSSGLIMYPEGHARSTSDALPSLLEHKFHRLAKWGVSDAAALQERMTGLRNRPPQEMAKLYSFEGVKF